MTPQTYVDGHQGQALIKAQSAHLIGRYIVGLQQIEPHPLQQELDDSWVHSLHQRFEEVGIDRFGFPIKVVVPAGDSIIAMGTTGNDSSLPCLPDNLKVFVYHGQHRVEACRRMMHQSEHWWCAEVYSQEIETEHPAEFITLMHMGNEDEHRLAPSDADRFLALHRLVCLYSKNQVTEETFQGNSEQILQSVLNSTTRQGLSNLVHTKELAHSIASAMEYLFLRPCFNGATWGKKLVKGRFFKLVACLVEEMTEQCRLLIGPQAEISAKPFQLPAPSCTWDGLTKRVKKSNHPWKEFIGGAEQALLRVLLLALLTSDGIYGSLKDMYHIAQHVIPLTAGRPTLDLYISNTPHKNDSDHPVGIFSAVLKEKLQGKASNYPHKIVYSMWEARQELMSELKTYGIGLAAETQREGYKRLLCKSESWWNLLCMFKMSTLPGQSLHLPKAFGELDQSKQEGLLNAIKKKQEGDQTSGIVNGQNSVGPTRPTKHHSCSPSLEIEHTAGALANYFVPGTEMRVTRSLAAKRPCLTASNEEQLAPVLPADEAGESDTSHTAEQGPN
ncbi:hypothetical protein RhiLY_11372 [Ceratobasidium sp. AG-Ba]|nr:hypothetical protein RhiLY_11372 [Ceratobasidium sp. AG-Ba]